MTESTPPEIVMRHLLLSALMFFATASLASNTAVPPTSAPAGAAVYFIAQTLRRTKRIATNKNEASE